MNLYQNIDQDRIIENRYMPGTLVQVIHRSPASETGVGRVLDHTGDEVKIIFPNDRVEVIQPRMLAYYLPKKQCRVRPEWMIPISNVGGVARVERCVEPYMLMSEKQVGESWASHHVNPYPSNAQLDVFRSLQWYRPFTFEGGLFFHSLETARGGVTRDDDRVAAIMFASYDFPFLVPLRLRMASEVLATPNQRRRWQFRKVGSGISVVPFETDEDAVIAAVERGYRTEPEICKATGINEYDFDQIFRRLHDAGRIHVARVQVQVVALGPDPDRPVHVAAVKTKRTKATVGYDDAGTAISAEVEDDG